MYMKHLCITLGFEIAQIKPILGETFVAGFICVALNLLTVESERSNYTQVLCEFCIPKKFILCVAQSFESLEIAF